MRIMAEPRPKYRQIDHTADAGIIAYGVDLAELFANAAYGLFDIITNLEKVEPKETRSVMVESSDLEALLVDWLSELNYLFLTERELYKQFFIKTIDELRLSAQLGGEKLDYNRHEIYTEVKAVTYHKLYVQKTARGWEAQVIFDL